MIVLVNVQNNEVAKYAKKEMYRFLKSVGLVDVLVKLEINHDQANAIIIKSGPKEAVITAIDGVSLLHGVYMLAEKLGYLFTFSGERAPDISPTILPEMSISYTPSVANRGIRMHLNFVQDQSCFTENEFSEFINNMAKQKLNYLLFHMYNTQEWFDFEYKGVRHTELFIGNLKRRKLDDSMIGREKIKVRNHWFPREFEEISNTQDLIKEIHGRYQRMMHLAKNRGITIAASIEPESLPNKFQNKLSEWSSAEVNDTYSLVNDWQEGWSGQRLQEADVRNPVVIDIAVERCLALLNSYPDLNELHLISREGTSWRRKNAQDYIFELKRISNRFDLPEITFDKAALSKCVVEDEDSIEMNPMAHPYWTVLPGDNLFPTVLGAIRFVEFAADIFADPRLKKVIESREIKPVVTVYSPNPATIKYMCPAIAGILPEGFSFHLLADYGASDIADGMDNWKPLFQKGLDVGMISWLEFDGCMMLAQGWCESLFRNIEKAKSMNVNTIYFNHWRVRGLEHNAAIAANSCFDIIHDYNSIISYYCTRTYGQNASETAILAYAELERVTLYSKKNNYNIGFTSDWVFRNSTDIPGYNWKRLAYSKQGYLKAAENFAKTAELSMKLGKNQAEYMRDLCIISAKHIDAVQHLQCAKLPLIGFKAWPIENPRASWPAPELLEVLSTHADKALSLENEYMDIYSKWVTSCDEQGQLAMHQQGVIEPFTNFAKELRRQLEISKKE